MRATLTTTRNLLLLALLLVGLRLIIGMSPVENALHKVTSPIASFFESLAFYNSTEVDADNNYQALAENVERENDELREQLGLSENIVTAEVMLRDITGFRKSLIINQGSKSGVAVGQAVVSDGFLVGKISRVTADTSLVQIITDPEFKVTAKTKGGSGGVVKNDSASLIFDLVDGADLSGQLILTDGVDAQLVAGIPVGTLGERISTDDKTFHTYHLLMGQPVESINIVNVIKAGQL